METNASCIGHRRWAIAEGYIPAWSNGPSPEMQSHETCCVLNAGNEEAHVTLTLYFEDRDPVGPYRVTVPARRTCHLRFNDLQDPAPVPRGTGFATSSNPTSRSSCSTRDWIRVNRPTAS